MSICYCLLPQSDAYLDDVKSLVDGALGIERESSVDFGGNLSWHDGQDFLSELNQKTVKSGINLLVDCISVLLSVCHSDIHKFGIFWLLRCREDQGGVGGGILGLVFADSWKMLV